MGLLNREGRGRKFVTASVHGNNWETMGLIYFQSREGWLQQNLRKDEEEFSGFHSSAVSGFTLG